ncbi:MAG: hypothetical protein AAFV93_05495, partial [Chloroflexota bacterium]
MVTATKVLDRADVPQEQRWNDQSVFASRDAWREEFDALNDELPKLGEFQGKLSDSPDTLANFWDLQSKLRRRLMKLNSYVGMSTSVDSTDGEAKAMRGQLMGMWGTYSRYTSFSTPELIAMGEETLLAWIADNESLSMYERAVKEMFRQAQYTRSTEVEQVMGMLGEPFG